MQGARKSIGAGTFAVGLLVVFAAAVALTVWVGRPIQQQALLGGRNTTAQRAEDRLPLIPRLDADSLATLIRRAVAADVGLVRSDVTGALTRLSQLDPRRALELAKAARDEDFRLAAIDAVIRASPPAAVNPLIEDLRGRERSAAELARVGLDPAADLRRVFEIAQTPEVVAAVFTQLSERNGGPAALAAADQLPTEFHRATARLVAANAWARSDPKSALAWALQLPASEASLQVSILNQLAAREPVRVVEAIAPRWPEFRSSLVEALQRWSERDLPSALAWLRGRANPAERHATTFGVLKAWVQQDASAALTEAMRLEFVGRERESLVDRGAGYWLRSNSAEAVRWFNRLASGQLRNNALGGFVRAIRRLEPESRLPMLERLHLSADDVETVREIVYGSDRTSLEPSLQWALARSDRALAAAFVSALANYAGLNRLLPDGDAILERWFARPGAQHDPSDSPLVGTAAGLLQASAGRATAEPPWLSLAPRVFVWRVFRLLTWRNPEEAVQLAAALSTPEVQATAQHAVEAEWRRKSPEAAQAWIDLSQPRRLAPTGLPADLAPLQFDGDY